MPSLCQQLTPRAAQGNGHTPGIVLRDRIDGGHVLVVGDFDDEEGIIATIELILWMLHNVQQQVAALELCHDT